MGTFGTGDVLIIKILLQPSVCHCPLRATALFGVIPFTRGGSESYVKMTFARQRMNNCILYFFQME